MKRTKTNLMSVILKFETLLHPNVSHDKSKPQDIPKKQHKTCRSIKTPLERLDKQCYTQPITA